VRFGAVKSFVEGRKMGTVTIEGAMVLRIPPELLGPTSEYAKRHNALKADIQQLILDAGKIKQVTTPEELEFANNAGRVLQASSKEVTEFYKPLKKVVDDFKSPLLDHEKSFAGPIEAEKRRLGTLITSYNQEVQRKREEAERVAREEADRVAREEQLARAIELEESGDDVGALQLLDEPIMMPAIVIQQEAPVRMSGQVGKTTYKCVVTDVKALLKAVANGQAPMQCFTLDQSWLDKKAALEKDGFVLPGCRLDKQASTHFRS
jgi:hypothetical protein